MTDRREKTGGKVHVCTCGSHRAGPFAALFFLSSARWAPRQQPPMPRVVAGRTHLALSLAAHVH